MSKVDWSTRTVNDELDVTKLTVANLMKNYVEDKLYVNRMYQRKLVWELWEKRLLIDSIIMKIPLPAIYLCDFNVCTVSGEKRQVLEIIDGLQRLHAIISFLLGEFWVEYDGKRCYFDPRSNNKTFIMWKQGDKRLKGHITPYADFLQGKEIVAEHNLLPEHVCDKINDFPLSVIMTGSGYEAVNLIFERINSTGRKVSSHDLRQSGAVGVFPDLVRRIASDVRKDNTFDDHIHLGDISKISIGPRKYGYGVDIQDVFWCRHNIIGKQDIRASKDEEIVEALLSAVLVGNYDRSRKCLDAFYNPKFEEYGKITRKLEGVGRDTLEERFKKTFDLFNMVFKSAESNFYQLLIKNKEAKNKIEKFEVLFLALYNLVADDFWVEDCSAVADKIVKVFADYGDSFSDMKSTVENLKNALRPLFIHECNAGEESEAAREIDRRLAESSIESQMTEFKIGISDFDSDEINQNVIHKIAKTLVAMANTKQNESGMLILGITDSREAYHEWFDVYKSGAELVHGHYVPGITCEAHKLCGSSDAYYRKLRKLISAEPISDKIKEYILENYSLLNYHDREIIVIPSRNVGETSYYDGKKYVRQGNELIEI